MKKVETFVIEQKESPVLEFHAVNLTGLSKTTPPARAGICFTVSNGHIVGWSIDNGTIEYYKQTEMYQNKEIKINKISLADFQKRSKLFLSDITKSISRTL